jgi:hypothetical protein
MIGGWLENQRIRLMKPDDIGFTFAGTRTEGWIDSNGAVSVLQTAPFYSFLA